MGSGRGGVVCELREDEAELEMGQRRRRRSGMAVRRRASSSLSFGRGGCGVLGALGWELASKRVDWVAGVLWVLGRARDGGPGYCVGLATAAARWRPQSSSGWRGEGRRGPARGEVGPGVRGGAT